MRQNLVKAEDYYRLRTVRSPSIQATTDAGTFAETRQINVRRPRCRFPPESTLRQTRPSYLYLTGTWVLESAQSSGQSRKPAVGHCPTRTIKPGSREAKLASTADCCGSLAILGQESRF